MALRSIVSRATTSFRGQLRRGDYTVLAIPAFFATMGIEALLLRRAAKQGRIPTPGTTASNVEQPTGYERRDTMASLAMGTGSLVVNAAYEHLLSPLDNAIYRRRVANLGRARWAFLGALVAWDLLYYVDHRLQHRSRLFWANHVAHHSSQRYNLSTALRQPWTGIMLHWIFWPMHALGFSPAQVARAGQLNLLYQYWVHTEVIDRLSAPAEAVLNTASHHRVHHGANAQYLDRNYAGILIVWDRLFRSFEPEGDRITYGLTKNIDTFNPLRIATHEHRDIIRDVRRASDWRERVNYVFGPPGWTPAASTPVPDEVPAR
ncbi:MAG: sterol desaturase family protein [Acidimicrobiia bacterium]|nr:sterol desaturase family protein [Acidimicrobiia bacterium]